jgi:quercetin dioxygenase-like cupin family protein
MTSDNGSRSVVSELGTWPLQGLEGKEVRLLTVEYGPGVHTPPHRHPGWQLIYVLEGPVVSHMEGEQRRQYETGEWWYEPREHLHLDAGNDGEGKAKILVFYLTEPGEPVLIPEPGGGSA